MCFVAIITQRCHWDSFSGKILSLAGLGGGSFSGVLASQPSCQACRFQFVPSCQVGGWWGHGAFLNRRWREVVAASNFPSMCGNLQLLSHAHRCCNGNVKNSFQDEKHTQRCNNIFVVAFVIWPQIIVWHSGRCGNMVENLLDFGIELAKVVRFVKGWFGPPSFLHLAFKGKPTLSFHDGQKHALPLHYLSAN